MELGFTISKIFDRQQVLEVLSLINVLEGPRWVNRNKLAPGRGINGATCKYDFCGQAQMDQKTRAILESMAPKFKDFPLAEVAINRYNIGDYLGKHRDRHYFRKNLVIALQEKGDGLYIDDTDEFFEDKIGQGIMFNGIGPAHSVPPVKSLRYTLIYLYE